MIFRRLFAALFFMVALPSMAMAWTHGAAPIYDPIAAISSSVLADFDASQGVNITSGKVTSWVAKTGGVTATSASTGATWSPTARNGTPGVIFTGNIVERLTFTPTGFPAGGAAGSMIVVGYNASNGVGGTVAAYGPGSVAGDSRRIDVSTGNLMLVATFGTSYTTAPGSAAWSSTDLIGYAKWGGSLSTVSGTSNGEKYQETYTSPINTTATNGRIGTTGANTNPWNGVIQRVIFFNRELTQLEVDKITGFLAFTYNLTGLLANTFPYKYVQPTQSATATNDPFTVLGMTSIFRDDFTALSLRTGGYMSGNTTGYNSTSAKGVWAVNGDQYMIFSQGYSDFGWGVWLNSNFNWQASIDPSFPPMGLARITADGVVLANSENYPLVRGAFGFVSGTNRPFLSSYLASTQAAKVAMPYAREYVYTLNQAGIADFPAVWSLSDISMGAIPVTLSASGNTLTVTAVGTPPLGFKISSGMFVQTGGAIYYTTAGTNLGTGTGGVGTYTLTSSLPTNFTADMSGTVMNVTSLFSASERFRVGQTITGPGVTPVTIVSNGTGTGGLGTYNMSGSNTVASNPNMVASALSYSTTMGYQHYEIDDFEFFGTDYTLTSTSQGVFLPIGTYAVGGQYNTGFTTYPGIQHTTRVIYTQNWVYMYFDGVLRRRILNQNGAQDVGDQHHMILNMASGMTWKPFPGSFTGTVSGDVMTISTIGGATNIPAGATLTGTGISGGTTILPYGTGGTTGTGQFGTYKLSQTGSVPVAASLLVNNVVKGDTMTVRRAEIFAAAGNTTYTVPSVPYPVPVTTWSGCCSGATFSASTTGTVAALSGATRYQLLDYNGASPSGLGISGSNLVVSGTLTPGTYTINIRGCAADGATCTGALTDGTPGIAPEITVTIN